MTSRSQAKRAPAWAAAALAGGAALAGAVEARADDCNPASGVSTCFDANTLWLSAGPTRFASIAPPEPVRARTFALAGFVSYLDRPVLLEAPSPDPEGREIGVVRDVVDLSLAVAYGLSPDLELTLAAPLVVYQRGAGAQGITSQSAPALGRTALRDPRLGVGYALPVGGAFQLASRLELGLPLGDEQLYAGAGSFTVAPSFVMGVRRGAFHGAAQLGARFRRSVPFATARVGSALVSAVGVGADAFEELLSFELEAFVMPSLAAQPGRTSPTSRVRNGVLVPAEWLFSLRSAPLPDPGWSFSLGGGTGLPLSSETRETSAGATREEFAGVTTPKFRLLAGVRYQPEAK